MFPEKARRKKARNSKKATASLLGVGIRVFVGAGLAKQLLTLEEGSLGRIELTQKRQHVSRRHRRRPADLVANPLANSDEQRHRLGGDRTTQQFLEHL